MNDTENTDPHENRPGVTIGSLSVREKREWLKAAYSARQAAEQGQNPVTRPSERAKSRSWLSVVSRK